MSLDFRSSQNHGEPLEAFVSDPPLDPGAFRALRLDRPGDVLRVTIDHPESELNAVDGLLHEELARLFRELKREDRARAVLLTGRGKAATSPGSRSSTTWRSSSTCAATPSR